MGDGSEIGDPDRTQGWKGRNWNWEWNSGFDMDCCGTWAGHSRASFSLREEP